MIKAVNIVAILIPIFFSRGYSFSFPILVIWE